MPRFARNDMMSISVSGPVTVRFRWKVSSEEWCDWLEFCVDGNYYSGIWGERDWESLSATITGSGSHRLK